MSLLLGLIASISLVVGGVGIMNIMLASVTERTREIGLRLALGARKRDIAQQFLWESVALAITGAIPGVLMGVILATSLGRAFNWPLIVESWSLLAVTALSAGIGIFFGLYPAMRASRLDPIEALRKV